MATGMSNTICILQSYLQKIENVYKRVLYYDDIDRQEHVFAIGAGGIVITVSKRDGSLTIQTFEIMSLKDTNGYLSYQGSPQTLGGFVYKTAEEVHEILEKLCDILLETSSTSVDAKIIKRRIMDTEFACQRKYHPISESTMQKMKFEAERAELNMSLKKG